MPYNTDNHSPSVGSLNVNRSIKRNKGDEPIEYPKSKTQEVFPGNGNYQRATSGESVHTKRGNEMTSRVKKDQSRRR